MPTFDPYYKWLGIPKKDQPPHHYRLLGIDLFEEDPEVIEAAADRCMVFVQQCALGEHLEASQQILNELAAARVCLLVPEQKEQYDAELRSLFSSSQAEAASPAVEKFRASDTPVPQLPRKKIKPESNSSASAPADPPEQTSPQPEEQTLKFLQNLSPLARMIAGGTGLLCLLIVLILIGRQFTAGESEELQSPDLAAVAEPAMTQPAISEEPVATAQAQPPPKQTMNVAQNEHKTPVSENKVPAKPETEPPSPTLAQHNLQLTVRGESPDQQPGNPLKDVQLELVYRPRENPGQLIRLGTSTTDENGQGQIEIQLNPQQTGILLAKLTREKATWERELTGFPKVLSHTLTIPAAEEPDYLNPDWIEKRLTQIGIDRLIEEFETEQDPLVQTIRGTLELSKQILSKHPEALREQLQARLVGRPEPELAVFQRLPQNRVQFRSEWPTFDQSKKRSRTKRKINTNGIAIASDGKFAITANDSTLFLWDLNTRKIIQIVMGHTDRVTCITISQDNNYIVSGDIDKTIRIWKYDKGKLRLVNTLRGHKGSIRNVAISKDGKQIISSSSDRTMKVWDFTSGRLFRTYDRAYSINLALNQKYLISSYPLGLMAWDITNGLSKGTLIRNLRKQTGHAGVSERINYLAFSSNGEKLMTGSDDNTLSVWEPAGLHVIQTLKGHTDHIISAAITTNGKQVISGSNDNTLRLWNLQDGKLIKTYELDDTAQAIETGSDGKSVIVGCSSGRFHKLTLLIPEVNTLSPPKLSPVTSSPKPAPAGNKPDLLIAPFSKQEAETKLSEWTQYLKQELIKTNTIGMKLKLIPPGEFLMGSPLLEKDREEDEQLHHVQITRPFYMASTEVTQGQWKTVMGTEPWKEKQFVKEGADFPASYVSWEDAAEYCRKLSQKEGETYRLPTEAEWEYACRAGSTTVYSFGDDASQLGDYAWYRNNTNNTRDHYAHRVGLKKANLFGLHDMHGNVYELCRDGYDENYYKNSPLLDPIGPASNFSHVTRGGSWRYTAHGSRSARRNRALPGFGVNEEVGFRVVCEIPPPAPQK